MNTVFSQPDKQPEHLDLIKRIRVPLPKIGGAGNIAGLSDTTLPLELGGVPAGAAFVVCYPYISIPAATTYTLSACFLGGRMTVRYVCTVENDDTKERITFTGHWNGKAFYALDVRFSDAQNNVVKLHSQSISY